MCTAEYDIIVKDGVLQTYPEPKYNCPKGIGYYIYDGCEIFADKLFQICPNTNKSLTFEEFKIKSVNLALNLRKLCSIQQGDIIMTSMKNSLENAIPIAATFFLNAITCSLDPSLSVRDCEHLIGLTEPKVIIVDEEVIENINIALRNVGKGAILIVNTNSGKPNNNLHLQNLLHSSEDSKKFRPVIVKDVNTMGAILFSSGTTGLPKGICLSHQSLYFLGDTVKLFMNNPKTMMYYTTFYWISGVGLFLQQFSTGTTKISLENFDVNVFCGICKKYEVDATFLATSYLPKLFQVQEVLKTLPSLKEVFAGGMMPSKGLFSKLMQTFPNIQFKQGYGMTEMSGCCCAFVGKYLELMPLFPDSTGAPLAGFEIKIVNKETGKILGPNETGIIHVKSKSCMLGYYRNNTESPFLADGFLNTGDMGYYDENKLIYISGRSKDMFKYQSWHIVPASIEAVIKEHPAVDEAVVFGIPHGDDGHLPSAVITLNKNCSKGVDPEEIANFVAERVADRQRLRGGVYILNEMPKTPTGKIQVNKFCDMITEPAKSVLL